MNKDYLTIIVGIIVFLVVLTSLVLWIRSRDRPHAVTIMPGEVYAGKIINGKEAEPRIEWSIEGDNLTAKILFEGNELLSTEEMKGSFSLKGREKGAYEFVIENCGDNPVDVEYKVAHRYIGSAVISLTVTEDIKLEKI